LKSAIATKKTQPEILYLQLSSIAKTLDIFTCQERDLPMFGPSGTVVHTTELPPDCDCRGRPDDAAAKQWYVFIGYSIITS
jgi:hypothetical protein